MGLESSMRRLLPVLDAAPQARGDQRLEISYEIVDLCKAYLYGSKDSNYAVKTSEVGMNEFIESIRALGAWAWNQKIRTADGLPYEFAHGLDLLGYMQCEVQVLSTQRVNDFDKRLAQLVSCHARLAKSSTPYGALIRNNQVDLRLSIERLAAANSVMEVKDLEFPRFRKHERPAALKLKLALIAMLHPRLHRTQNKLIRIEKTWHLLSHGYAGSDRRKLARKLASDIESFMQNDSTEYRYWYAAVCGNLFKRRVFALNLEFISAEGSWRVGMPLLNQNTLDKRK